MQVSTGSLVPFLHIVAIRQVGREHGAMTAARCLGLPVQLVRRWLAKAGVKAGGGEKVELLHTEKSMESPHIDCDV